MSNAGGGTAASLEEIAGIDALTAAWKTVLQNDLDDGELSAASDRFAADATARIATLSSQLLAGSYRPAPLHPVSIPKQDGSKRELRIPALRDRIVERAIADVLGRQLDAEFSPWSFGYRKGLGVIDAIRALVERRESGCTHVLRTDVSDCFESLHHDGLLAELTARVDDPRIVALVALLLARGVSGRRAMGAATKGAPQGGPLSPLLANLYLHRLDMRMLARGWTAIRYADDVAVPVTSAAAAGEALAALSGICDDLGIELGADKTDICSFADGFAFLGEDVNARYPQAEEIQPVRVPERKALYVGGHDLAVHLSKGRMVVRRGSETVLSAPVSHVGSITLFGPVGLSAGARQHSLANDIHVTFPSRRGSLMGTLRSDGGTDPARLRAQVHRSGDEQFRLSMAKSFITGKLHNQRTLLLRFGSASEPDRLVRAADSILQRARDVNRAEGVAVAMGLEGAASADYFSVFDSLFPEWVEFPGRRRNPPTDPVNALLSYGYTILTSEATGALASVRLDAAFGFLHHDARDRPSLALDLIEEFRPLIVDAAVVNAVRRGTLTASDFRSDERNGGILLTENGRRKYLAALETRMLEVFTHLPTGRRASYRRAIFLQARQIAAAVESGDPVYESVRWRV